MLLYQAQEVVLALLQGEYWVKEAGEGVALEDDEEEERGEEEEEEELEMSLGRWLVLGG